VGLCLGSKTFKIGKCDFSERSNFSRKSVSPPDRSRQVASIFPGVGVRDAMSLTLRTRPRIMLAAVGLKVQGVRVAPALAALLFIREPGRRTS
jgi:hypothetical protein